MTVAILWAMKNWKVVLLGAAVLLLGMVGVKWTSLNRKLAEAQDRVRSLEGYRKTRRESDEVDELLGGDPDAARRAMHKRKPRAKH